MDEALFKPSSAQSTPNVSVVQTRVYRNSSNDQDVYGKAGKLFMTTTSKTLCDCARP